MSSTSLDGCGVFSSVVVRLPFNLISDACVMGYSIVSCNFDALFEEVSHVYVCLHLDQKSNVVFSIGFIVFAVAVN